MEIWYPGMESHLAEYQEGRKEGGVGECHQILTR
jgi:hypothetical protein